MIVGIDEVGRGSWAGPLCVAAVAWPDGARLKGLADSKLVPRDKRAGLVAKIKRKALGVGIGWVSPQQIDVIGMGPALKLAAEQALAQINVEFDAIIIDGVIKLVAHPKARTQIKADNKVPAVMAASLVAKVARDTYMQALHSQYTQYNFASHVGYGTPGHKKALAQYGPCDLHRFSYAPLHAYTV